jgi:hypothetical protein
MRTIQVLAPVLITYRVSTGDAWSRNTSHQANAGRFVVNSSGSRTVLGSSGGDTSVIHLHQESKGAPV